jgi:hypothetical protein
MAMAPFPEADVKYAAAVRHIAGQIVQAQQGWVRNDLHTEGDPLA